jgi:site-specific DNA-methyltransferase (adenine-specific)
VLDEEAGAALDAQTGDLGKSAGVQRNSPANKIYGRGLSGHPERDGMPLGFGDTGGASRFFYCAKASTSERGATNKHPTVKPLALMRWLCQLVTPPGGVILDPFAGSGTTLLAADALGFTCLAVEREAEHVGIITDRYRAVAPLFVEAA